MAVANSQAELKLLPTKTTTACSVFSLSQKDGILHERIPTVQARGDAGTQAASVRRRATKFQGEQRQRVVAPPSFFALKLTRD